MAADDAGAPTGTPEPGAGTEKKAAGPDYEGIVSRFKDAGIDILDADPEQVAGAVSYQEKYGGKDLFTSAEVDARAQATLREALASPQAKQMFAQQFGQPAAAAPSGDAGDDDQSAARIAALERAVNLQTQHIQQQEAARQADGAQVTANKRLDRAIQLMETARATTPGAEEDVDMATMFVVAMNAGDLGTNPTPTAVNKWVRGRTKKNNEKTDSIISRRAKAKSVPTGGDVGFDTVETVEEWEKAVARAMPG